MNKLAEDVRKKLLDAGLAAYEKGDIETFRENSKLIEHIGKARAMPPPPKPKPSKLIHAIGTALGRGYVAAKVLAGKPV
jgi:hypothetical protein